jgi:hypothetical protein
MPVLVDETSTLIAGHGRVMAARKLGLAEVPVMVGRGWSEAQRRAYVLADNKRAMNAGIADEITGRSVYAVELNPAYVDVAVKRWQDFTGQQAILESDGRAFADVAAGRLGKTVQDDDGTART